MLQKIRISSLMTNTLTAVYLSFKIGGNQAKVLGVLDKPAQTIHRLFMCQNHKSKLALSPINHIWSTGRHCDCNILCHQQNENNSLLLEDLLFVFGPNIHELPGFVHLHRVVHQAVHVNELHSPLLRVIHHGWDDWQLSHLLLVVLWNTDKAASVTPLNQYTTLQLTHEDYVLYDLRWCSKGDKRDISPSPNTQKPRHFSNRQCLNYVSSRASFYSFTPFCLTSCFGCFSFTLKALYHKTSDAFIVKQLQKD